MHFYQFNVKDYASATAHLTVEEDCCYRRLLDLYYDQESPFDSQNIYWLARRVRISAEIVQTILDEFFDLIDGFYTNSRANHEIETYQAMKKGGKKGSDKRWHKGSDTPPIAPLMPPLSPTHVTPNANHEPITNNQVNVKPLSDKSDGVVLKNGKQKFKGDAEAVIAFLNEKTGKAFRPVKANLDFVASRLQEGATVSDCRKVIAIKCRQWLGTENAMYLRPETLFNATKFAQYVGELVPVEE